jgi:hypothetical protein
VWTKETGTPGSQAKIRFLAGVSGFEDGTVTLNSSTLPGPFAPGVLTDWQELPAGAIEFTVAPKLRAPIRFKGMVAKAGELWTIAIFSDRPNSIKALLWREGEADPAVQHPVP